MQINDALMVAAAGITVVFSGLIITNLLILSLPRLLKLASIFNRERKPEIKKESGSSAGTQPLPAAKADPEVIAVISTVLEIERRLSFSRSMSRYTFKDRKNARTGLVR